MNQCQCGLFWSWRKVKKYRHQGFCCCGKCINNGVHSLLSSFPPSTPFYRRVSLFLTSPFLPLWHRFKPSHIIRESRASLLCLWGFPSRLYNDLPVGLFWFWRRSLLANPAQLWPRSSPNRTHFVLDSVFGTSCSCTTPAADSFVWLAAGFFFLHHLLFSFFPPQFDLFFRPRCPLFPSILFFSVSLFVSFLLTFFPALASSTFFPPTVCRRGC